MLRDMHVAKISHPSSIKRHSLYLSVPTFVCSVRALNLRKRSREEARKWVKVSHIRCISIHRIQLKKSDFNVMPHNAQPINVP